MNPMNFRDTVAEGKRRTVPYTDEAIDNVKKIIHHFSDENFKLTQFEAMNLVLELADPNDIKLASAVQRMRKHESARQEKEKLIREKVAKLTPEELARALDLLGK